MIKTYTGTQKCSANNNANHNKYGSTETSISLGSRRLSDAMDQFWLPDDILLNIFAYLDSLEQTQLRRVCKAWNAALTSKWMVRTVRIDFSSPLTMALICSLESSRSISATTPKNELMNLVNPSTTTLVLYRSKKAFSSELNWTSAVHVFLHRLRGLSHVSYGLANLRRLVLENIDVDFVDLSMLFMCAKWPMEKVPFANVVLKNINRIRNTGLDAPGWQNVLVPHATIHCGQFPKSLNSSLWNLMEKHVDRLPYQQKEQLRMVLRGNMLIDHEETLRTVIKIIKIYEPHQQAIQRINLSTLNTRTLKEVTIRALWDEISRVNLVYHACG